MEEKKYVFFDYFNSFQQWLEEDNPTDKAVALYTRLFCMMNRRGWQGWAEVNTQMMMSWLQTQSNRTAYRARDALVRDGMIEYRKRGKNQPYLYRLLVRDDRDDRDDKKEKPNGTTNSTIGINDIANSTTNSTANSTTAEKEREKKRDFTRSRQRKRRAPP